MPNAVPITEPFPYQCASSYFSRIRHLDAPVWLDSGVLFASETNNQTQTETGHRTGRFDILAAQPLSVCRDQQTPPDNSPSLFERAQHMLNRLSPTTANEHPFHGGLIGSFAYETNHQRFGMASKRQPALTSWFGLYAWALVIDHKTRRASLVSHPDCPAHALEQARHCLSHSTSFNSEFQLQSPFYASQTEAEFCKNVATIKDYLHAGDCYQVNLAQHFSASFSGDAYHAYLALRSCSPTPFGGFLDTGDHCILSCSPEEFLCITPEVVSTQPIKGTRPRYSDPDQDRAIATELQACEKDRAENLMIVDLMRNDLSEVGIAGTTRVDRLFELQSFPTVHHLVSKVSTRPRADVTPLDVLRHCLPGGSITGAPKKRAMQIIDQLESVPRGPYCGSMGYLSSCGRSHTNIGIRTLLAEQSHLHCWGGGGIVADSQADSEFQETLDKVRPLMNCLEQRFLRNSSAVKTPTAS